MDNFKGLINNELLLQGNQCGLDGSWKIGRSQDVTTTGGCIGLGIRVPTVANDLLKMDLNLVGQPLLYFGIAENPTEAGNHQPARPTSYLPAMEQCRAGNDDLTDDISNDLPLTAHARIAVSAARSCHLERYWCVLVMAALGVVYGHAC